MSLDFDEKVLLDEAKGVIKTDRQIETEKRKFLRHASEEARQRITYNLPELQWRRTNVDNYLESRSDA